MKYTFFLLLIISAGLYSCDKCNDDYCIGDIPLYFDITDSTGRSLDSTLAIDSIPFDLFYYENSIKEFINPAKKVTSDGMDTLYMSGYITTQTRYFLQYMNDPADTLDFTYEANDTDCCGKIYSVIGVSVNGTPALKDQGVYQLQIKD